MPFWHARSFPAEYALNHQLQGLITAKLVDVEPEGDFDICHARIRPVLFIYVECNSIDGLSGGLLGRENQLQMILPDPALLDDLELAVKHRLGEFLPPGARLNYLCGGGHREFILLYLSVAQ